MGVEDRPETARARAAALASRGDLVAAARTLEEALASSTDDLERAVLGADLAQLRSEIMALVTRPTPATVRPRARLDLSSLVGASPELTRVREAVRTAATSDAPVLIEGPSGSGKEHVARVLHDVSSRAEHPFFAVNAATLAGPVDANLFLQAGRGTILLDNVDELSRDAQKQLLRVFATPGGCAVDPSAPPARILATSRRSLRSLVRSGAFREDLFQRFNVLSVEIPPLAQHVEDVPALVTALLARHSPAGRAPAVTAAALERLARYGWPGDVRELENELRRILVVGGDPIDAESLSPPIRDGTPADVPELSTGLIRKLGGRTLEEIERAGLLAALEATDWNITKAAHMLAVTRRGLYAKMRRLGLERPRGPTSAG